ncbi:MAG: ATP-dependent zinc protease [Desulfobacter sp.]|nr:MAG: ATP-dependent zinc protease [Desulfobacter sp.]
MIKHIKPILPVIGWREWVSLPDLGVNQIKVKVDTGARSSSLHAIKLNLFERDGEKWVRFQINPLQEKTTHKVTAEAKIIDFRSIRSSNGMEEMRPVISTHISLLGLEWPIELTLSNRDEMGFRMLLGRQAFRDRFYVDAGRSFYGGQPKKKKARKKIPRD